MDSFIVDIIENNYTTQLLVILLLFFFLVKLAKLCRLFLVYFFQSHIKTYNNIVENSGDYVTFKKQILNKIERLEKKIDDVDIEAKKRSEKNENKIYEIWKK